MKNSHLRWMPYAKTYILIEEFEDRWCWCWLCIEAEVITVSLCFEHIIYGVLNWIMLPTTTLVGVNALATMIEAAILYAQCHTYSQECNVPPPSRCRHTTIFSSTLWLMMPQNYAACPNTHHFSFYWGISGIFSLMASHLSLSSAISQYYILRDAEYLHWRLSTRTQHYRGAW